MFSGDLHIRYYRRSQGRIFTVLLILLAVAPLPAIAIAAFNVSQAAKWASFSHTSLSAAFQVWLGNVTPDNSYPGGLILARDHLEDAGFALASIPATVFLLIRLQRRRRRERALLTVLESARSK
jgi:hypothetical protein